ncbi:MAG: peptidylprolyl isomerase [Woeseiaceae bacterium]
MHSLLVSTALGEFTVSLHSLNAPETCDYFVSLAERGELDTGGIFRVVADDKGDQQIEQPIHVVQLGTGKGFDEPRSHIKHESTDLSGLSHHQWTVSAARFAPGELYASFFVCMDNEPELDFGGSRQPDGLGFAAFGKISAGFSTLRKLYAKAGPGELLDRPIDVSTVEAR